MSGISQDLLLGQAPTFVDVARRRALAEAPKEIAILARQLRSEARPGRRPLIHHTRKVTAVTAVLLPDGRVLLATGSDDGTVGCGTPPPAPRMTDEMNPDHGHVASPGRQFASDP